MIKFILSSSFLWFFILLLYQVFFRNEKYFLINRLYLLFGLIGGLIIPTLDLRSFLINSDFIDSDNIIGFQSPEIIIKSTFNTSAETFSFMEKALIYILIFGSIIMLIRLILNLNAIYKLYQRGEKVSFGSYKIILVNKQGYIFSFFNYIFFDKGQLSIDPCIIQHESIHIHQKHTIDILILEIFKISFWYNPLIYFFNNYIRENHEFIADDNVIQKTDKKKYCNILIGQLQSGMQMPVSNSFINSLIKNRIKMMYNNSKPNRWWKYPLVFSFLVFLTLSFNLLNAQTNGKPDVNNTQNNASKEDFYKVVDKMPEFPGGMNEMMNFLAQNIKYPDKAKEKGIEGKAILQFIVEEDGSVSHITILKNPGEGIGEEAKRVVGLMPKWKPGENEGKIVKVQFTIPVSFKLEGEGDKNKLQPPPPPPPPPPPSKK